MKVFSHEIKFALLRDEYSALVAYPARRRQTFCQSSVHYGESEDEAKYAEPIFDWFKLELEVAEVIKDRECKRYYRSWYV